MKRFLLIALGFLAGCWGLRGQDVVQAADSVAVPVSEEVVFTPDGIYWIQGDLKKKGKTIKLKAKAKAESRKLKVKKHRASKYETSNPKVAKVNGKGAVKGVGKGTCFVYAYAQNGAFKRVKVTVK